MKELSVPFSLFDFFAVLLPGATGLFGLYLFVNPALTQVGHDTAFSQTIFQRFDSDLALITSLVLASYLGGLVLSALSELLIDIPANRIFGVHMDRNLDHHNVKKAVQRRFAKDILRQSARRTFTMIESAVGAHMPDAATTAKKFIALAVMFQGLTLALLIVTVALVRGYVIGQIFADSFASLFMTVTSILVLVGLTLWSYRRYKRMWSGIIFMSFVAWADLEEKPRTRRAKVRFR